MTFQPEGHYSRGNGVHWTGSVHTPLGSHPIKSTASWVPACQVHWPLPCCVQGSLKLRYPSVTVGMLLRTDNDLTGCGVLRGAAQGATMVILFPVCAQGVGRRELKEGQAHVPPCCLSS